MTEDDFFDAQWINITSARLNNEKVYVYGFDCRGRICKFEPILIYFSDNTNITLGIVLSDTPLTEDDKENLKKITFSEDF